MFRLTASSEPAHCLLFSVYNPHRKLAWTVFPAFSAEVGIKLKALCMWGKRSEHPHSCRLSLLLTRWLCPLLTSPLWEKCFSILMASTLTRSGTSHHLPHTSPGGRRKYPLECGSWIWRDGLVDKNTGCFSQRTWVQFPARTWWLTDICNSSSGGSDALCWPLWALHAHGI